MMAHHFEEEILSQLSGAAALLQRLLRQVFDRRRVLGNGLLSPDGIKKKTFWEENLTRGGQNLRLKIAKKRIVEKSFLQSLTFT